MDFEIKDGVAVYSGTVNAAYIASALFEVMELAKTQDIQEFRFTIPNVDVDVLSEFHQFAAAKAVGKGIIEPYGSAVNVRYTLRRTQTVHVEAIGTAPRPSLNVPEPIDLAYRSVM